MINAQKPLIPCVSLFVATALFAIAPAYAVADFQSSENSAMTIPAEGNGKCADYAANSYVKEMSGSISCPTSFSIVRGTVYGPDATHSEDPLNTSGESAEWTYNCATKELAFSNSSIGINYTVTKASRNITWYPYGKQTFKADSKITNQDPGTVVGDPPIAAVLPMASFALCYDLNGYQQFVKPTSFPECSEIEDNNGFANSWLGAINCGEVADGTVVTLWQPLENNMGDRLYQCVCNENQGVKTTVSCDPNSTSGDLQACYTKDMGQPKATTVLEFDADPIVGKTSGADRTCKCVDNPFTPLVNECATTQ